LPVLLVTVATALVLAGCNTGSMQDARQSQEFDKAETPQLSAQQATRTAETFFSPTATPAVPTVVPPKLESLVITLGVGPDGAPSGSYLSVPTDAGTAYAAGRLRDVRAGQVVAATWTDSFGNIMGNYQIELTADTAAQWVSVPLQLTGALASGDYAVYLFGDGRQLGSLAFTITGPGSGAQLLPDLPANPQARSTVAPRQSQENDWQDEQDGDGDWEQNEGNWQENQSQSQWEQPAQDQWNQQQNQWQPQDQWQQPQQEQWQPQDQWNQQPQDQWQQPQDQWNQEPQG
jgi:hypothetical protein